MTADASRRPFEYMMWIRTALMAVIMTAAMSAVLLLLPAAGMRVRAAGIGDVSANSALIQGENVVVSVSMKNSVTTDDGLFHLYAQQPCESGVQGIEVAQAAAGSYAQFVFPLNFNTPSTNLFKKFTVAVRQGGALVAVSNSVYITNPEALAVHTMPRRDFGKKGILPAATLLDTNGLTELGVKQIVYNLPVGNLCSGGGVSYTYNGKTYQFNANIVGQYDKVVPLMNLQGIQVTLVILNNRTSDLSLLHPMSRDYAGANYYAFNTAEIAAIERLEAVAAFLADRYSDKGHGTVDNWVIGNEVNARLEWNYMNSSVGMEYFTAEYAKTLRVFYNAIRSQNANARIYASFDQEYSVADGPAHYGGQPMMMLMNAMIQSEGNIDWHVAYHPYNYPLYDPIAWLPNSKVTHDQSTRYITMQNLEVLTDFLCTPEMLSPTGQVRSVLLTEVGYTSMRGEQFQAAAVVYGYMQAMANQHVDGFILSRQLDDAGEIRQGLALGLLNPNGSRKLAYEFYRNIDGPNAGEYIAAAGAIVGADINTLLNWR
ncbi:MAG: hypothetical protein II759_02530 [Lachnospiraceae bacterium]|nr:hypothetical protein [Lachnospiraceae bacterium]